MKQISRLGTVLALMVGATVSLTACKIGGGMWPEENPPGPRQVQNTVIAPSANAAAPVAAPVAAAPATDAAAPAAAAPAAEGAAAAPAAAPAADAAKEAGKEAAPAAPAGH